MKLGHSVCLAFVFFLASAFCLLPAGDKAHTLSMSAIYAHNQLALTIPYHASRSGPGKLTVELLSPEDEVLGHAERETQTVDGDGEWSLDLTPTQPLPFDDLVWERIRYRYVYTGDQVPAFEDIRSVSEILRRPAIHILAQSAYIAGSQAAIRVLVNDSTNHLFSAASSIRIELLAPGHDPIGIFSGRVDRHGTVDARFRFPAGLTGDCQLHYIAETPLGSAEFTQPVRLEDKVSILLTTEKPLYQPGQTVHIRALALDRADRHAAPGPLTFEIEDSRGNKVFRKATATDAYGIASAEFTLADEVNLGTYHLRALTGDPAAPSNSAEIAINVDRYVLPKFKVSVDFSDQNGKPRRDYRPGDHVTGIVHTNYFFGEPVANAPIEIKATSMDVALAQAGSTSGTTDKDGTYRFDLKLPSYFAGRPLDNGTAPVLIEATVKDASGHAETRGEPVTVSASSILVTAVPEGGTLIPGLENQVFLLASYPDGSPAAANLAVRIAGAGRKTEQKIATDASGVAAIHFTPSADTVNLSIDATDTRGNRASATVALQSRNGDDQILLRTARAVYKVGDRIDLSILSTEPGGSAYVDLVRDGQTILTRDVDVIDGQAALGIDVTPEMAGTLEIHAYRFGQDAQAIGDRRLIFVEPASELHIQATADAPVYKPGAEAKISFRVTGEHGEAVHAALGIEVVDEAVFALAEKQPGFAKVFFYLEQELMKPRYEIHSLSMNDVIEPVNENAPARDPDVQTLHARALFASMQMANPNNFDTEFGRTLPEDREQAFNQRYRQAFVDQVKQLAASLSAAYDQQSRHTTLPQIFADLAAKQPAQFQDAWGTPLRLESTGWNRGTEIFYNIRSAGPDRQYITGDDFVATVETRTGGLVHNSNEGSINLKIEHDRGPLNGLAAIAGTVADASGGVVPGATVSVLAGHDANPRTARSDAAGNFNFAALPPGRYEVRISSPGFMTTVRQFDLEPRDRAVVAAILALGSVSETVNVVDAVRPRMMLDFLASPPAPAAGMAQLGVAANAAVEGRGVFAMQKEQRQELKTQDSGASATTPETHIRSYFPEALYINPEIITDRNGEAAIQIPIADSITTWRMAMLASTMNGALGTATSSLKVFQDFFADLDLPVTLTQGDRVTIPAAVYNYAGTRGDVDLTLQPEDWYSLVDDSAGKNLTVEAGQMGGADFTLEAKRIGKFKLTLSARMKGAGGIGGSDRRDIVVREIEVAPNGREQDAVFNGRIDPSEVDSPENDVASPSVEFPAAAIPDASKILVRLYPGPLSQVVEGMDSLLRMPFGCFEQTSSSTYPNVLALDYMKRTNKLTPEIHAKAEGYIATGYQRLLTFEVPGGGFSWFGEAPANKILTAYGLMEFNDMSRVHDVDPRLIERTRDWLIAQQQPDGSWKPDASFINEGATNRYNSDLVRITAYIAWSLEDTGYRGLAVEKAAQYLSAHLNNADGGGKPDAYTLAVLANFAAEHGEDEAFTHQVMEMLLDAHQEKGEQAWWTAQETGVYSTGESAAVETTGLAVQALLKAHQSPAMVRKALTWITAKKDADGTWGTTQATIMALRALLMASQEGSADVRGSVEIALNGNVQQTLELTADNNDLYHQFVLTGVDPSKPNQVRIHFHGTGSLAYQVVGRYFLPWQTNPAQDPLSIDIAYDRTRLAQNDIVTATATVRNHLNKTANMVMVDLGIPPGFDLLSEDLQDMVANTADAQTGRLEKFSLTATQAILYFNAFAPGSQTRIQFRLRAKYPVRARTFESKVYEYYDPAVSNTAAPAELEVTAR